MQSAPPTLSMPSSGHKRLMIEALVFLSFGDRVSLEDLTSMIAEISRTVRVTWLRQRSVTNVRCDR